MQASNGGGASGAVRVLVAVTDQGERRGVGLLLGSQPNIEVVGEVGEQRRAVALAAALKPHVMVVDLLLPVIEYLRFLHQVASNSPRTQVVILDVPPGASTTAQALVADDLVRVIRADRAGRQAVRITLPVRFIGPQRSREQGITHSPRGRLTPREEEVVRMTTTGLSSTEAARQLGISPRTVETHRAHAMRKLGLHRRAELVRYAIMRGMFVDDPSRPPEN